MCALCCPELLKWFPELWGLRQADLTTAPMPPITFCNDGGDPHGTASAHAGAWEGGYDALTCDCSLNMETNIWIPDDDDVSGPSRDRAKKRLRKYFLAQRVAWVRDAGFAWWLTITCVCGMLMASSVIAIELTTLHSRRHEAKERATLDQPVPLRGAPPPGGTPRPPSRAGPLDRQAPHELMRGAQASVPLPPLGDTDPETDAVMRQRRDAVRDAFRHAWRSYRAYAWGHDELRPVSNRTNDSWGGFGITVVDALDTLWIMGLRAEWREAREHVRRLSYRKDTTVSVFETTIRHMGGLLAAYTLSRDALFLQKAEDLAKLLLPAFNTPYRIPYHSLNLQTQVSSVDGVPLCGGDRPRSTKGMGTPAAFGGVCQTSAAQRVGAS